VPFAYSSRIIHICKEVNTTSSLAIFFCSSIFISLPRYLISRSPRLSTWSPRVNQPRTGGSLPGVCGFRSTNNLASVSRASRSMARLMRITEGTRRGHVCVLTISHSGKEHTVCKLTSLRESWHTTVILQSSFPRSC
jgi:hypothetical protein